MKKRMLIGLVAITAVALLFGACSKSSPAPVTPSESELTIQGSEDARDAAIAYLQTTSSEAPNPNADWQGTDVTTPGLVGATKKQYVDGDWIASIAYNVVRPDLTEYQVII